jgi:hypothetical protein
MHIDIVTLAVAAMLTDAAITASTMITTATTAVTGVILC